jgi:hypothetical protein
LELVTPALSPSTRPEKLKSKSKGSDSGIVCYM